MSVDIDSSIGTTDLLRALGDPVRWRITELLAGEDLCVCHLVAELDIPQSLVSHHLRAMRDAGLVETERFRYWTYYRLRPDALAHIADRLSTMADPTPKQRRPCC